jgi:hypothetical protein
MNWPERVIKIPTARALAIVHTSAFNAWSAYTADAQSTEKGNPRRSPEDEWTAAKKDLAILTR